MAPIRYFAYANDVNLKAEDIKAIERNADILLNVFKDNVLAVNTGKTKNMLIGCHRSMIANENIRICSNSYQKVKTFKYLASLATNQILLRIK